MCVQQMEILYWMTAREVVLDFPILVIQFSIGARTAPSTVMMVTASLGSRVRVSRLLGRKVSRANSGATLGMLNSRLFISRVLVAYIVMMVTASFGSRVRVRTITSYASARLFKKKASRSYSGGTLGMLGSQLSMLRVRVVYIAIVGICRARAYIYRGYEAAACKEDQRLSVNHVYS